MPSAMIIMIIEFKLLGMKMFWALFSAHFILCLAVQANMILNQAQNIKLSMPMKINSDVLF